MLNFFKKKPSRLLGLDIGSFSVKLIELSKNLNQCSVEHYAIVPITQSVSHAIEQAVVLSGTPLRSVAIAMPNADIISKTIQLDSAFSLDEMEEIIMLDMGKYFHYPLQEISFDFEILGPSFKNEQLLDVLLVASRSAQINERIKHVNDAGLTVDIVDAHFFALKRACNFLLTQIPNSTKAIIDIGHRILNIMVLHENKIIFSRSDYIQHHDSIFIQIQRSLHFFFSSFQQQGNTEILLSGSGGYSQELCSLLQTTLKIPVTIANPFSSMSFSSHINIDEIKNDARCLMTCCGLAIRNFIL